MLFFAFFGRINSAAASTLAPFASYTTNKIHRPFVRFGSLETCIHLALWIQFRNWNYNSVALHSNFLVSSFQYSFYFLLEQAIDNHTPFSTRGRVWIILCRPLEGVSVANTNAAVFTMNSLAYAKYINVMHAQSIYRIIVFAKIQQSHTLLAFLTQNILNILMQNQSIGILKANCSFEWNYSKNKLRDLFSTWLVCRQCCLNIYFRKRNCNTFYICFNWHRSHEHEVKTLYSVRRKWNPIFADSIRRSSVGLLRARVFGNSINHSNSRSKASATTVWWNQWQNKRIDLNCSGERARISAFLPISIVCKWRIRYYCYNPHERALFPRFVFGSSKVCNLIFGISCFRFGKRFLCGQFTHGEDVQDAEPALGHSAHSPREYILFCDTRRTVRANISTCLCVLIVIVSPRI